MGLEKIKWAPVLAVACVLGVSACTVTPEAIPEEEHIARAAEDRPKLFRDQEPVTGPLDLYSSMARAIKYNLDVRMRFMLERFQEAQVTSANLSMLPTLGYSVDYTGRNNSAGSNSKSLITDAESLEVSTSSDRETKTLDVGLTWNILDLGISYVRAKQTADRRMIAREQTRKVIHTVIRDTRAYYWQAVVANRLLPQIDGVLDRAEEALAIAKRNEEQGLSAPLDALTYRSDLLEQISALKSLRQELSAAKVRFQATLSLPVMGPLSLSDEEIGKAFPDIQTSIEDLETLALVGRPELREEGYQERINRNNVHRALLQILPGLELSGGYNMDSNSYAYANRWWDWGAAVTGNLLDVFAAPYNYDVAQQGLEVVKARRLALSMAVVSQVHVSWIRYQLAKDDYASASDYEEVKSLILGHTRAGSEARTLSDLDVIQSEVETMIAQIQRLNAYVSAMTSLGDLFVSAGTGDQDLPASAAEIDQFSVAELAETLRQMDQAWKSGEIDVPDLTQVQMGAAESPAQEHEAPAQEADGKNMLSRFWDWMTEDAAPSVVAEEPAAPVTVTPEVTVAPEVTVTPEVTGVTPELVPDVKPIVVSRVVTPPAPSPAAMQQTLRLEPTVSAQPSQTRKMLFDFDRLGFDHRP